MDALRERFGKYHVLEKIAQGGMAEVYKVKTVGIAGFEKVQALKRILPNSAREGRFIRSFIDEARIAVELTHRNIVQVFDFGKADGELFLAMELIEGKDLRTAMGQAVARELLPPSTVSAYIISEVAAGLDYAHRKTDGYGDSLNIVHCDVSPSNVMLSGDGYVKILDFGIARATFASALERRRLRGKPRYMAPEQTLGEPPTAAADVFALGIIAWEMFTGMPLYRGPNLKSILEAVRTMHPPRIDRLNDKVPAEIVDAVAIALSRDPEQRGTAADLGQACARSAMAAGARALCAWLADIEARPGKAELPWSAENTSVSVPKPGGGTPTPVTSTIMPPPRASARSIAGSLANVPEPGGDLGEGTPGYIEADRITTSPSALSFESPERGSTSASRFETTPVAQRFLDSPTATSTQARWGHEGTVAGVGRLADAMPDVSFQNREPTVPTEPSMRPSYEVLQLGTGAHASALRFDDDITHSSAELPAFENTSYDSLEVEGDNVPLPQLEGPVDEPIDDDLGSIAAGVLMERRRAVVVAALLAGAPADVLKPLTRSLGELAYQRGGVVTAQDDDLLMVAFGLEVAGEDDVAIAMGWALDAAAMARDASDGVVLKVGARTGVVTTASDDGAVRIPPEASEEAVALARESAPERPMFVGTTGRLTSDLYTLRELPAPKRIARRSRVIEVVGPRSLDDRERARLEKRGKFIGRTKELAELEVWFQRAIAADRRLVVLINGAAGTGKSRLVTEMTERRLASGTPTRVVATGASPAHHLSPFALVIDLIQTALGLPPGRGRAARQALSQRLLHRMKEAGAVPDRVREIAVDLDRAMELRDGVGIGAPEIADLRPRVSAGLAAFRTTLGDRNRPRLTILEDIHLADSASLEVLRHTLAVPAQSPELMILTARPEGPAPPAVDVVITIGDLVGSELRQLVADRLGPVATPLNIAAVLARGGGNPLFIEELAQAVREAGDDVPASARDVVAARVDKLSAKAKTALRYAAVLGGTIRIRILEELLEEESLGPELEELIEAGFLVRSTTGSSDPREGDLHFARGLVREVVYESLSARTQRDTHAQVGRLLASRFFAGREEPPAVIAEHLERGGEPAGAAAFWLRAGRLAITASDTTAAVSCFTRTIALERELGAAPPTMTSRARRREALGGREEAHRLQGDLQSDAGDLDELQRLCEGEPERLADVALRRAQRMLRWGDYANASMATMVAEDHAIAAGDDRLRGEALRIRSEILERLGRYDEALVVVTHARELFHRIGSLTDEMAAMIGRGRIHLMRAHYPAARDAYKPVVALIDKTGDPWLERIVTNHVAVIEMCLGNFTTAMTSAKRSLELCRRYGDRGREGDALSVAGIIQLEVGLYEHAAVTFAEALDILSRTQARWSRTDCLIYAGICDLRRNGNGGMLMIDEALSEARRLGARYLEANALVARAGAQLRRGAFAAAIDDAVAGTTVAMQATLTGYAIQGTSRHALAMCRLGHHIPQAAQLANRALSMLDQQKVLEGSEEEVYAACYEVLTAAGDREGADVVRQRGRISAKRKLDALTDPIWKAAYAAIPEVRALLSSP